MEVESVTRVHARSCPCTFVLQNRACGVCRAGARACPRVLSLMLLGSTAPSKTLHTALEELRELAHGSVPGDPRRGRARVGLWNLVDEAPIAVELVELAAERAIHTRRGGRLRQRSRRRGRRRAARREATHALVRTRRDGTNLVVEVEDDASRPAPVPSISLTGSAPWVVASSGMPPSCEEIPCA